VTRELSDRWRSEFCLRLRAERLRQRGSLETVERRSHGRFKAVVVGSYERGNRNPTAVWLAEYARFLGVPIGELVPNVNPWHDAVRARAGMQ
jgi:transcriptional regulator with XRE-family HTH domain